MDRERRWLIPLSTQIFEPCCGINPSSSGINRGRPRSTSDASRHRRYRMNGFPYLRLAAGVALLLGAGFVAQAQVAPPQIAQRQDLMKSSSAAVRTLVQMARGTQAWNSNAAKQAAVTI